MPNHILAQEGILMSFSIAKKVTADDVSRLKGRYKKSDIDSKKLQEMIKNKIIAETHKAMSENKIPGLVMGVSSDDEKKKIMELTYFASLISKKMSDKKIDKYHACYIVNAIVNILGLNEDDFEDFNKRFSKYKQNNDESEL